MLIIYTKLKSSGQKPGNNGGRAEKLLLVIILLLIGFKWFQALGDHRLTTSRCEF